MNRVIWCTLVVLYLWPKPGGLLAQSTPDELIASFFQLYEEKGSDEAIDFIFSTNKWMARNQDGITKLKTQLRSLIDIVGTYYGHDEITRTSIGENYVLSSYMVRYDRQPVRFTFLLYKPDQTWQIQNFQYDDEMGDELREAAKMYRLTQRHR